MRNFYSKMLPKRRAVGRALAGTPADLATVNSSEWLTTTTKRFHVDTHVTVVSLAVVSLLSLQA